MKRRTKIICTLGPASTSPEILEAMVIAGMDIARFNFSHATEVQFLRLTSILKEIAEKHNKKVEILADLQGPRIRVGKLPEKGRELIVNETVTFTTDPQNKEDILIDDPYLHEDIEVGHPMYLVNGDIELIVTGKNDSKITTRVVQGGIVHSRKAVNIPQTNLTTSGLTNKDLSDSLFVAKNHADYIALSFVKDASDVQKLRKHISNNEVMIIAKIERLQALQMLDEIIAASDAIMVARGDLGIEVPLEELPLIQKDIIKRCLIQQKPSIVATQLLMSMVSHYRPTRAEVTDVANAVLEGAWGLMLCDETSFGNFPVESVKYLAKIIDRIEIDTPSSF